MTRILRGLGIDAIAVNNDPVPRTLQKFVGDTPFVGPSEIKGEDHKIVTVDCADHARIGDELKNATPMFFSMWIIMYPIPNLQKIILSYPMLLLPEKF